MANPSIYPDLSDNLDDEKPKTRLAKIRHILKSYHEKWSSTWWFITIWLIIRLCLFLAFLYFFICSLSLMSDAFRLIAGKNIGRLFRDNELLQNPIVDLMIGVLVTMMIQSSSTTSAIMISMASANVIPIDNAIFVLFGAEIGTSVTNTLVSIGHIANRDDFRRAFAAASIQCVFNWLSILIFFPLEATTHCLRRLAGLIVQNMDTTEKSSENEHEMLNVIIKPLTHQIVRLDQDILDKIGSHDYNETAHNFTTLLDDDYTFLFSGTKLSDVSVGVIIFVCSIAAVFTCLGGMAKTMHSIFAHQFSNVIKRYINSDLPGRWKPLTAYIFIVVGAVTTCLIQSSTVFTATLTPMVGVGIISVDRVFPLILGSNIGTTSDAILGALAQDSEALPVALQIAIVQILFNVLGVLIFYPIPFLRNVVIQTGKWFGKQTCKYRWFALVYILVLFFFLPLSAIALSMAGDKVFLSIGIPLMICFVIVSVINALQAQKPNWLPEKLRNWTWLPEPMYSLDPYDRLINRFYCCNKKIRSATVTPMPQLIKVVYHDERSLV